MQNWWLIPVVALSLLGAACEKSPSQKAEDTMEDAGHEAGQAMERAGEKVDDATK